MGMKLVLLLLLVVLFLGQYAAAYLDGYFDHSQMLRVHHIGLGTFSVHANLTTLHTRALCCFWPRS